MTVAATAHLNGRNDDDGNVPKGAGDGDFELLLLLFLVVLFIAGVVLWLSF